MYKEGSNVVKLSLARVIKVNYKYNTVDVISTLHKNTTSKNPTDNGRFSARLPVALGGRTPEGKPYGSTTLVTVGTLVLVGFLEGNKDTPIVLNVYGDADNQSQLTRTSLTSADESDEEVQRELWQLFTLYPSMTYRNIDGNGNTEMTFSGKSFMYITDTDPDNDYVQDDGFDYQDLPSSRYANGELIEPKSPNSPTLLYVHQGVYDGHRVTFFIKADGTLRVGSRHLDGKGITFQEMRTDGTYSIVQQKDSTDPEMESKEFSKMEISKEGEVVLQSVDQKFEIRKDGVYLNDKPFLSSISEIEVPGIGDLKDWIKGVTTTIEAINGKIESKVSKTEYSIDLDSIIEYAEGLVKGVETEVADITKTLTDFDSYLDGAFMDGIVEASEATTILSYINTINKDKADLDAQFDNISINTYLTPEEVKALTDAKVVYDDSHTWLIDTINNSIVDGKITASEKATVDRAIENYNSVLAALSYAFQTAIDAITSAKMKAAKENALDYVDGEVKTVNSTITQLAESVTTKVGSETFSKVVKDLNSTLATKEEAQAISNKVGEVQQELGEIAKNVAYKAEIISTQGLVFKNGIVDTILFCRVYKGATDITEEVDASRFKWTRISDDVEGDNAWNVKNMVGKKSVTITDDDVNARATFNCEILEG